MQNGRMGLRDDWTTDYGTNEEWRPVAARKRRLAMFTPVAEKASNACAEGAVETFWLK